MIIILLFIFFTFFKNNLYIQGGNYTLKQLDNVSGDLDQHIIYHSMLNFNCNIQKIRIPEQLMNQYNAVFQPILLEPFKQDELNETRVKIILNLQKNLNFTPNQNIPSILYVFNNIHIISNDNKPIDAILLFDNYDMENNEKDIKLMNVLFNSLKLKIESAQTEIREKMYNTSEKIPSEYEVFKNDLIIKLFINKIYRLEDKIYNFDGSENKDFTVKQRDVKTISSREGYINDLKRAKKEGKIKEIAENDFDKMADLFMTSKLCISSDISNTNKSEDISKFYRGVNLYIDVYNSLLTYSEIKWNRYMSYILKIFDKIKNTEKLSVETEIARRGFEVQHAERIYKKVMKHLISKTSTHLEFKSIANYILLLDNIGGSVLVYLVEHHMQKPSPYEIYNKFMDNVYKYTYYCIQHTRNENNKDDWIDSIRNNVLNFEIYILAYIERYKESGFVPEIENEMAKALNKGHGIHQHIEDSQDDSINLLTRDFAKVLKIPENNKLLDAIKKHRIDNLWRVKRDEDGDILGDYEDVYEDNKYMIEKYGDQLKTFIGITELTWDLNSIPKVPGTI